MGREVLAERSERFGGDAATAFAEAMAKKRDGPECLAALADLEAKNTAEVPPLPAGCPQRRLRC